MKEIEIEKYNKIDNKNRKMNLLSVSIFKMIGPYRPFDKYINFIKNLINNFYDKLSEANFDIRIYFDNSCLNEIKPLIQKYKYIEFYKYNYQPLRIGEFHNGTFGTIVRLLPIFNEEDYIYDYIWVNDIDIYNLDFDLLKDFKINNKKFNTVVYSFFCYKRPWINPKFSLSFPIITNLKLDIKLLLKFLEDIVNNKYKNVIEKILTYRNYMYKYDYDVKFPYGMDEYFTNMIIYTDLTKKNSYFNKNFEVSRLLKKIQLSNLVKDKRDNDIIKELLDLGFMLWKTDNLKIKNEIINTYIKLLNKIGKDKIKHYFSLINENECIDEFYDYLKNIDLITITDFYKLIPFNTKN
jgi:hypothetical protein